METPWRRALTNGTVIAGETRRPLGPLVGMLLLLTAVTGVVDAVSYLKLGHVFVANMTGNVVFLGFAAAGASDVSIPASLASVGAFLLGSLIGGRLGNRLGAHRARLLTAMAALQTAVVGAALTFVAIAGDSALARPAAALVVVALLAVAMGLQNAVARRIAIPDLTTTVLTMTLSGLAADSHLAGSAGVHPGRRIASIAAMLAGAVCGALLVLRVGVVAAVAFALLLIVVALAVIARSFSSSEPWTRSGGRAAATAAPS
jgi:uncharacterized membrane protein YoaK (UPF0700 family)